MDKKVSVAAEIAEQMTLRKIYGHLQIKLLKDEIPQYSACKFGSIQFCNSMCPFILQIWLYLVKNFSFLNFILENAMRASLSMDPTICTPENSNVLGFPLFSCNQRAKWMIIQMFSMEANHQ